MTESPKDRQSDEAPDPKGWHVEGIDEAKTRTNGARWGKWGLPPLSRRKFWITVAVLLALNWVVTASLLAAPKPLDLPYSTFLDQLEADNIATVTARGDTIEGEFVDAVQEPGEATLYATFETERPTFASEDGLLATLRSQDVIITAEPLDPQRPLWQVALFSFGPTLVLVWIFVMIMRRMSSGGGIGGLGRSKARRYDDASALRVTFADVAGIDEAAAELTELVDFLRHPDKYARLGGRIPRGVLLSGPPGTGKTLLARAVAGEANVPFFSSSASEFIEMVVGVGASRVRDLFAEAKKLAPSIVFIDELDAIGRSRSSGGSVGGHDEREQTLNQILTEMDGFDGSEGVIVLAATNRPEILDSALMRPGRFDRQVVVNPPDQTGRRAILEIHSRGVPLAPEVDLDQIAATTPGMVGADLANLVNESALTAARRGHDHVTSSDITDSLERILLGMERRIVIDEDERRRTAYHEAGHALLGMLEPGADPVRKISIIPRGRALGVTLQTPDTDRYAHDTAYWRGRIVGALGGRAAEELVYGSVTTGAQSDLETVTRIARAMVGQWGMNDAVGLVTVLPTHQDPVTQVSPRTLELVDHEVRALVHGCYAAAMATLRTNRARLDDLASALLEQETLDEVDAYAIAGVDRTEHPGSVGPSPLPVVVPTIGTGFDASVN